MRKSLIIYSLLLPFLLASGVRFAPAMSDAVSSSPWSNPAVTVSEIIDDDDGVSVDNLFTIAPLFDSVTAYPVPILELDQRSFQSSDRYDPRSLVNLNQKFRI